MKKHLILFLGFLLACAGCRQDDIALKRAMDTKKRLAKIYQEKCKERGKWHFLIGSSYLSDASDTNMDNDIYFKNLVRLSKETEKIIQDIEAIKQKLYPKGAYNSVDMSKERQYDKKLVDIISNIQKYEESVSDSFDIDRSDFFVRKLAGLKQADFITKVNNLTLLQFDVMNIEKKVYLRSGSSYCGIRIRHLKPFIFEEQKKIHLGEEYMAKIGLGIFASNLIVYSHLYLDGKKMPILKDSQSEVKLKYPVGKHRWEGKIIYLKEDKLDTIQVSREFEVLPNK